MPHTNYSELRIRSVGGAAPDPVPGARPRRTRPLFYSLNADRIVFASDVGAVLAAPEVPDALDETALATLLTKPTQALGERTCYRAVRRLPPGHTLTVTGSSSRLARWWRPEDAPAVRIEGDDALAEAFLELYGRAVEDCMRACAASACTERGSRFLLRRRRRRACAAARGAASAAVFAWQPPPAAGRTVRPNRPSMS